MKYAQVRVRECVLYSYKEGQLQKAGKCFGIEHLDSFSETLDVQRKSPGRNPGSISQVPTRGTNHGRHSGGGIEPEDGQTPLPRIMVKL